MTERLRSLAFLEETSMYQAGYGRSICSVTWKKSTKQLPYAVYTTSASRIVGEWLYVMASLIAYPVYSSSLMISNNTGDDCMLFEGVLGSSEQSIKLARKVTFN